MATKRLPMSPYSILVFLLTTSLAHATVAGYADTSAHSRRVLQAKKKKDGDCPVMYVPYMSSIRYLPIHQLSYGATRFVSDYEGNHVCGAVVISKDAVLSSASCVDRRIQANIADKPLIHIGGVNSDKPVQKRRAERIFFHEGWDGDQLDDHNLAILKLDQPTCVLPVKYIGKRDPKQDTFLVFGYGRLGSSGKFASSDLNGANVTLVDRTDCSANLDVPVNVGSSEACFRTTTGTAGICAGDEGGPIMHAPFAPVYEDSLIAIASYTAGDCDSTNSVAVAIDVSKFKGWIKATLASDAFKEAGAGSKKKKVSKNGKSKRKGGKKKGSRKRKN